MELRVSKIFLKTNSIMFFLIKKLLLFIERPWNFFILIICLDIFCLWYKACLIVQVQVWFRFKSHHRQYVGRCSTRGGSLGMHITFMGQCLALEVDLRGTHITFIGQCVAPEVNLRELKLHS